MSESEKNVATSVGKGAAEKAKAFKADVDKKWPGVFIPAVVAIICGVAAYNMSDGSLMTLLFGKATGFGLGWIYTSWAKISDAFKSAWESRKSEEQVDNDFTLIAITSVILIVAAFALFSGWPSALAVAAGIAVERAYVAFRGADSSVNEDAAEKA